MMTTREPATAEGAEADFELYDLRIDVVGPSDHTVYCGARMLPLLPLSP